MSRFSSRNEFLRFPNFYFNAIFSWFLEIFDPFISKLISKLFLRNFHEFKKTGYFRKISKLRKLNYSKTRENKKFGKFCLTQGLSCWWCKTGANELEIQFVNFNLHLCAFQNNWWISKNWLNLGPILQNIYLQL